MSYILLDLPKKKFEITINFFIKYQGELDIYSFFCYLQKGFKAYKRMRNILSLEEILLNFNKYFKKVDTNITFELKYFTQIEKLR